MAFIDAQRVSKSFAAGGVVRHVLRNVTLSVGRGEFVSIVGAMGSGKSTLLGILAGLTMPDAGTVTIGGQPVRGIRSDVAYVFQNYSLLPWLTALDNVSLAIEAAAPDLSRVERRARALTYLEMVGLAGALDRRPGQLSGGMRQRVALARALRRRAGHPVSGRTVWSARRADAGDPSAGARADVLRGQPPRDDRHDHEQCG